MSAPPRLGTVPLLLCVLAALGVSLFFWNTLPLYPFQLLVTLMHESGHAIVTKLVGGRVISLTVSPSRGGLTQSVYPPSLWRAMAIDSAGYVGSAVAGATLLWAAGRMRSGRLLLTGLVVWMVGVAIVWVPIFPPQTVGAASVASGFSRTDGLFTLAFILGTSAFLLLVAWKGALWLRQLLVVWIATLSCFAALQDIKRLFGYGAGGSDADNMARVTHIPAAFWAVLWMLLSLLAIAVGLRSILRRPRPAVPPA